MIYYIFIKRSLFCFSLFWALTSLQAQEKISFQSSNNQAKLIELFTSQGCSSCPPAENWINSFLKEEKLWQEFVPVAFHVDYWDYLGWKDVYAKKQFTKRQRAYRATRNLRSVYTPAFLLNGKEWRGGKFPKTSVQVGILSGILENNQLHISYSEKTKNLELHVVLLGFGVQTHILGGENANLSLAQEFLALDHQKLFNRKNSPVNQWILDLPANSKPEIKKVALAIWVSDKKTMQVVQATGFWL